MDGWILIAGCCWLAKSELEHVGCIGGIDWREELFHDVWGCIDGIEGIDWGFDVVSWKWELESFSFSLSVGVTDPPSLCFTRHWEDACVSFATPGQS